jgi:hypothetical protein
VRAEHVAELVRATGVTQVHASASTARARQLDPFPASPALRRLLPRTGRAVPHRRPCPDRRPAGGPGQPGPLDPGYAWASRPPTRSIVSPSTGVCSARSSAR